MVVVRRAVVGVGAALLAGVLMGSVARVMMRLVAVATGHNAEFSASGTVSILLAFVVLMVPGALLASLWRGRGRSLLLVAGTVFLLVVATGIAVSDIGDVSGLSVVRWMALAAASLGVYAAILGLPFLTFRILTRGVDRPGHGLLVGRSGLPG